MPGEFVPLGFTLSCDPHDTHPDVPAAQKAGLSWYARTYGDAELRWEATPVGQVLDVLDNGRWESTGITIGIALETLLGATDPDGDYIPGLPAHRYPPDAMHQAFNTVVAELGAYQLAWRNAYADETANTAPGSGPCVADQVLHTPGCHGSALEHPCDDCASEQAAA
ncbi:hypothetical protein ACFZBU_39815 [Embleya sp. NPDC008237]|uniref:hypothetical protein n=1 Tax=Embleya sp. NPDC008237 TaxID=3363978 RepID=UPI0036F1243B